MFTSRLTALTMTLAAGLTLAACSTGADDAVTSDAQDATDITLNATPRDGGQVELYRSDSDGQYYWRLKAPNGEIILRGEGYKGMAAARNSTESIKRNGVKARAYKLNKASNGEWYFNVVAPNGEIIGSSETYSRKSDAKQGANVVASYLLGNTMVDYWSDQCGFEMYLGDDDGFWFRLRADNGEKLLKSQSYDTEQGAKTGIDTVVTTALNHDNFEVFAGADGQFYWRLVAQNGHIVATGGEGFATKASAWDSVALVKGQANEQASCWTVNEPKLLGGAEDDPDVSEGVEGALDEVFIGEMDPFVVGDVCIIYLRPFEGQTGPVVGLLDSWCESSLYYADMGCEGCELGADPIDLLPVSAAEDEVLQDYREATYYWLEGEVTDLTADPSDL